MKEALEEKLKGLLHTEKESDPIRSLIKAGLKNKSAFAMWRNPQAKVSHLIIDLQGTEAYKKTSLEELSQGFIFAPFNASSETLFIHADIRFSQDQDNILINPLFNDPEKLENFNKCLKAESRDHEEVQDFYVNQQEVLEATDKADFIGLVEKGIEAIEAGEFQKIVPSRRKLIDVKDGFDLIQEFEKLAATYPNAFVSLVSIPEYGTWLGATPELLISLTDNKIFRTVALAGTQPFIEGIKLSEVAWRQKEIEEQALVSRYIINCFKKIRLREFEEYGPKTVIAGNLMHLKTEFEVDIEDTNFPLLSSVMLELLHPTSAVCGMPLAPSQDFLLTHENYNRSFFSGYLGPVNIDNTISLFVNLRCLQYLKQKLILYAGAGVTASSDPQKEWDETELKCNTLLSIINRTR
ncbi:MAG: chorismate-binding protein [Bacteroidota bacterium]